MEYLTGLDSSHSRLWLRQFINEIAMEYSAGLDNSYSRFWLRQFTNEIAMESLNGLDKLNSRDSVSHAHLDARHRLYATFSV